MNKKFTKIVDLLNYTKSNILKIQQIAPMYGYDWRKSVKINLPF